MDLNQLRYFAKVAEKQSISKAANELFISQPALSMAIHNLENELGHYLFIRNKFGVTLTPFGEKILTDILEILNRLTSIEEKADQEIANIKIKIATIPSFVCTILPIVTQRFSELYPDIPVIIEEKAIPREETKLALNDYTFILTLINENIETHNGSGISKKKKFNYHLLFTDKPVALFNTQHPLASKENISFKDLLQYPLLVLGNMKRDYLANFPPEQETILYDRESMKKYLCTDINSIGIILSLFTIEDIYIDAEILTAKPLAINIPVSKNGVYYDKTRPLSQPEQIFLNFLIEEGTILNRKLNPSLI